MTFQIFTQSNSIGAFMATSTTGYEASAPFPGCGIYWKELDESLIQGEEAVDSDSDGMCG